MNAVPGVDASGETRATDALLLSILTDTPPCSPAPSVKLPCCCNPDPTVAGAYTAMPGDDTVTSTVAASVAMKPAMVADTVVVPLAKGSKAAPPAATEVGES